jgi:hypothetical protein
METAQPVAGPAERLRVLRVCTCSARRRPGHNLAIAVVAAGLAASIAACSSAAGNGTGSSTNPTGANSPFALAKCMRAHGIANFPDPTVGPGGSEGLSIDATPGSDSLTVDGITFGGPAFQAAEKACRQGLPGGGGPPPAISAARRKAMLANAQCMRKHGVPNFPDPTFPAGGGISLKLATGVNPDSPAFKQAQAACGRHF